LQATSELLSDQHGHADAQRGHLECLATTASTELEGTARSMSTIARQTDEQAGAVSESAQSTSSGVQTVAAATEELTASIQEISR
jgi:methyl-accepting chemotaxis protein